MEISTILFLLSGIVLLSLGGEGLIRGSSSLAISAGIKPLVVGLTIVAFATSSPELFVSLNAVISGNSTLSLGNVIGSNICNLALILGITALIRPVKTELQIIRREIPVMLFVTFLFLFLITDGEFGRIEGVVFLVLISVYIITSVNLAAKENKKQAEQKFSEELPLYKKKFISILLLFTGLASLVLGSELFVTSAVRIARHFKIDELLIGLTIVAIGTSLPEMIASIVAAIRDKSDIAIGNIIGSNIFNLLLILGLVSVINPLENISLNYPEIILLILTSLVILPFSKSGFILSRFEGGMLVGIYLVYIYLSY